MSTGDSKENKARRLESIKSYNAEEQLHPTQVNPTRVTKVRFQPPTVLLDIVTQGDLKEIDKALCSGIDLNSQNADGLSGLHVAILEDNMEVFKFLLGKGADVNLADNELWTPLHLASKLGSMDFIDLIAKQPTVDLVPVTVDGDLPIDVLEMPKQIHTTKSSGGEGEGGEEEDDDEEEEELAEEDKAKIRAKLTSLCEARHIGPEEIQKAKDKQPQMFMEDIKLAESKGYDLNACTDEGASLLHVAISRGYIPCVRQLVSRKVNLNLADRDGWTPAHCAAYWARDEALQVLHQAGANLALLNKTGSAPIDLCSNPPTKTMLQELLTTAPSVTTFSGALNTWRKLKWTIRFAVGLWEAQKKESLITRKSTSQKDMVTKKDIVQEALALKNAKESKEGEGEEDDQDKKGKKTTRRRSRRTTGVLAGPTLELSTATATTVVIKWDPEFVAEWFNIYRMVANDPSTKKLVKSQVSGHNAVLTGMTPSTTYEISVVPGQGEDDQITALTSAITVTTAAD